MNQGPTSDPQKSNPYCMGDFTSDELLMMLCDESNEDERKLIAEAIQMKELEKSYPKWLLTIGDIASNPHFLYEVFEQPNFIPSHRNNSVINNPSSTNLREPKEPKEPKGPSPKLG